MCGIAGIAGLAGIEQPEGLVKRMTDAIAHRGPNAEGVWKGEDIVLGHRRLSIIDLSDAGNQPFHSADGRYHGVYNGEIYNYLELKADLEARGYKFRTNSDTETIIHAYEEYGADCLNLLRGMFAFAIWDERQQTLFIARDRVGKKPLFYSVTREGDLVFG